MSMPRIEIDPDSGFCFGVVTAINKAEAELAAAKGGGTLYCLGDIVHNSDEVERLCAKGLRTITHADLERLRDTKVLLRAHGEPPETYRIARENNIEIVDATCPVVLKLQQRIKAAYDQPQPPQIVIYGKIGHAEVNGLVGQTEGTAIVVEHENDLDKIDFHRPVALYSQTTKSVEGFRAIADHIRQRIDPQCEFTSYDTICRSVSKRVDRLREFASSHDIIIFVAGTKSSNGKILFNHCLEVNRRSFMIPNENGLQAEWLSDITTIGICGATSTPRWLMERVKERCEQILSERSTQDKSSGI